MQYRFFFLVLLASVLTAACATLPHADRPRERAWQSVQGTCGIDDTGNAWCFGWDPEAQPAAAVPLAPGTRFVWAGGSLHQGCALAEDDIAWCWGPQLLAGARTAPTESCGGPWQRPCEFVPRPVATALRFTTIDVGGEFADFACGITTAGETWCWGRADGGRLGPEPDSVCHPHGCFAPPARIPSPARFNRIAVGGTHACGLTADGQAWCWGAGAQRQLGEIATERCRDGHLEGPCSRTPLRVRGGHAFTSVTLGGVHACGLTGAGRLLCWGSNIMGQLGTDRELETCPVGHMGAPCTAEPVPVAGELRFSAAGAFHQHTCGLTPEGAYCWGEGDAGQLGQGFVEPDHPYGTRRLPVRVTGGQRFDRIAVGRPVCGHRGRELLCWGVRSPFGSIAAPTRIAPPPPPVLATFMPRQAAGETPFTASLLNGRVVVTGGGPVRCANHSFHAGIDGSGDLIELHVRGERWQGGGCNPSAERFAWDATLDLPPGTWRIRAVQHTHDDRGDVTRTPVGEINVTVPG